MELDAEAEDNPFYDGILDAIEVPRTSVYITNILGISRAVWAGLNGRTCGRFPHYPRTVVHIFPRGRCMTTYASYADYLESTWWKTIRRIAIQRADHRCQDCGFPDPGHGLRRLEVHHLTYERLGCEIPIDLLVLCGDCHAARHGKAARGTPTLVRDLIFPALGELVPPGATTGFPQSAPRSVTTRAPTWYRRSDDTSRETEGQ